MLNFKMSEKQARNIHAMADQQCKTIKNHIVMYVEQGNLARAQDCVEELREYQALFAAFNRVAAHEIAASTGKEVERERIVSDSSR